MKKSLFGLGGLAGLVLGVAGCGTGIGPEGLPSDSHSEGREMVLYEEDLQIEKIGSYNSLSFEVEDCGDGSDAVLKAVIVKDKDGRKAPFDAKVISYDNSDRATVRFTDNSYPFTTGEVWDGILTRDCGIFETEEDVEFRYHKGHSPEFLTDRVDDVEDEVFGYIKDDNRCDSHLGENATNSPRDCAEQPTMLERVINYLCGLPRPSGNDLAMVRVTQLPNGALTHSPVDELSPNVVQGMRHYFLPTDSGGDYLGVLEGNDDEGIYAERIEVKNMNSKLQTVVGYVPPSCDHIAVLNPNGENLSAGVFDVYSYPEN